MLKGNHDPYYSPLPFDQRERARLFIRCIRKLGLRAVTAYGLAA